METTHRLRLSTQDAHYGGNLIDGARVLALFGDVATELLIRQDGDEGLLRAYDSVEFLAPLFGGDFVEVFGKITTVGNTSRKMIFECYKIIKAEPQIAPSAATLLPEKTLVARASATCIVPKQLQRF